MALSVIDAPGAVDTAVLGVSPAGQIYGSYRIFDAATSRYVCYGFIYFNGVYTTIANPGKAYNDVRSVGENGTVYGNYMAASDIQTGFANIYDITFRIGYVYNSGVFSNYRPPSLGGFPGTLMGRSESFAVTGQPGGDAVFGNYSPSQIPVGFFTVNGTGTAFDPFLSGFITRLTVTGIDYSSALGLYTVGYYDNNGRASFIYETARSAYSLFSIPGAAQTTILGVKSNVLYGYWKDSTINHGFYSINGINTTIDVPGATDTKVNGIDSQGNLVGVYIGSDNVAHGFAQPIAALLKPVKYDFNGDQASDILWFNTASGTVLDWQLAGGRFSRSTNIAGFTPGSGWAVAGTGDFNGDKTADVLLTYTKNSQVTVSAWTVRNGAYSGYAVLGGFGAASGWATIGTGDFNGDKTTDVLLSITSGNSVSLYEYEVAGGATVGTRNLNMGFTKSSGWTVIGTGDFDADGVTDILFQNTSSGLVADWSVKNGVASSFTSIAGIAPGSGWTFRGIGDFNGDGFSDVLWQNGRTLAIWEVENGALLRSVTVTTPVPVGSAIQAIGNYMGNGISDILWQNTTTGATSIWAMQAAQVQTTTAPGGADPSSWRIVG